MLWSRLRRKQLEVRFRQEDPIGPFVVDFACRSRRLVVVTDGITHTDPNKDARRDRWLARHGWTVVRFSDDEVLEDLDAVIETIWMALQPRPPFKGDG